MPLPKPITKAVWTPESFTAVLKDIEPPFPLSGAGFYGYARDSFKGPNGWTLYKQIQISQAYFTGNVDTDTLLSTFGDNKIPVAKLFITAAIFDFQKAGVAGVSIYAKRNGARTSYHEITVYSHSTDDTHKSLVFNPPLLLGVCDTITYNVDSMGVGEGVLVTLVGYIEETDAIKF